MPISVDQPSSIAVSSSNGGIINVSVVSGAETKVVSLTSAAANNISISGAIGSGPAGPQGPAGPAGATGPAGADGADGQGVPTGGVEGQVVIKQSETDYDTAWDYVESVYLQIQNDEGSTLSAGTPVYAKGISGNSILIGKADADDSSKMPAIGVLLEETTDGSSGEIITAGLFNKTVSGLTGVSVGDTVFVSNTGTLTTTKPTGSSDLLQNIGIVLQTNGSNIQKMKVSAIDRTNDIPNLASGTFFLGGATGQISPYTLPVSDGTNGQALVTDGSGALSFGDVDSTLESAITISNTDAAFNHMTSPITAGTSLEAVLRDMLEKYNITTISLSAVKSAYQNTDGTYPATANKSSFATLEVGRGVKSDGFSFSIADTSQTADTSVLFKINGTTVASSISETGSPATYTADTQDVSSPATRYYRVEATDNGSGTNNTISAQKGVTWRWLVKLAASSTSAIADDAAAQTLYDGVTEMATNLNSGSSWNNVSTTSAGNSQSNYTYIIFPASFGDLQNVVQNNALSVIDAFQDLGDFTIDNQYGVSVSYSFYRTNQTAAFATDTELDITF